MKIDFELSKFYSPGDEARFFSGLRDIRPVKDVTGVGRGIQVCLDARLLSRDSLWDLISLLWRYQIPLRPLAVLSKSKKFLWIKGKQFYWHESMFEKEGGDPGIK
ncbi:hypothetical protein LGN30_15265 [Burkholderia seminalis]|uniref:hypothetical protein n=1 Tax=Burkholderia seminalis TaxID=488731 RepID=UPI001CF42B66|nr:hypothetical protein [Burkholderia seminalis]MCA8424548.1 hypothetical protein [Burkholderia seminalis]